MLNEEKRLQDLTDAGAEKVAAMLGSLAHVEAPGDFNAHVRARIAKGRPSEARSSWFPVFTRIAAPALVLMAVGGYFGYNALYQQGNVNVPEVADSQQTVPAPENESQVSDSLTTPGQDGGGDRIIVQPADQMTRDSIAVDRSVVQPTDEVMRDNIAVGVNVDSRLSPDKKPTNAKLGANRSVDRPGGGSVDLALRETNSVSPTVNSNPTIPATTLSVREVFSAMGIRASHSGAGWRVSSASGRAAAAGLKAGDIIESVNGKPVDANTVFDANFTGRSLLVKRDGASIQISL